MSSITTPETSAAATDTGFVESEFRAQLLEELLPLIESDSTNSRFARRLLELCVIRLRPRVAGIDLRVRVQTLSERCMPRKISSPQKAREIQDLMDVALSNLLTDDNPRPRQRLLQLDDVSCALVTIPIPAGGKDSLLGGFVFGFPSETNTPQRLALQVLTVAADVAVQLLDNLNRNVVQQQQEESGWSKALKKASEMKSLHELSFSLVNSLCNRYHCEQVGIAMVDGARVRLEAVSGIAVLKQNNPGIADMRQAMEECLDHGQRLVSQPYGEAKLDNATPLHRRWSASTGNSAVCTFPLKSGEETLGALALRRHADRPFTCEELKQIEESMQPFVPLLGLMARASRSLKDQLLETAKQGVRRYRALKSPVRWTLPLLFTTAVMWFCLGRITYRPVCKATVIPSQMRQVTAPFEGRFEAVLVSSGQTVKAGQPLVRFETHACKLDLSSLESQAAMELVNLQQALNLGDPDKAAVCQARLSSLTAQIEILQDRLRQATIVAPQDGIILHCDVEKRIGAMLALGEPVLQFAGQTGWDVEIEVPDAIAPYVVLDQVGSFAPQANPQHKFALAVTRVDGAATPLNGSNVVRAQGRLSENPAWLKSGMIGHARIDTVRRPVWWVVAHRLLDSLRMNFWM